MVHDCPVWDVFDSDWYTSYRLIGGADIIVIKYSVNDKTSFQELKDSYVPMVKKALNHFSVPVIISAVGARKNGHNNSTGLRMTFMNDNICRLVHE